MTVNREPYQDHIPTFMDMEQSLPEIDINQIQADENQTDLEIDQMESEMSITDLEIAVMELQDKVK